MPDGVTHFEIGLAGGIAAVLAAAAYTDYATTRAVAIGSLIGLAITPDLDQEGTTFTERILRRIPLIGFVFQVSWYGYALLFRHRGWSHNLLLGTLTRVAWAGLLLVCWSLVAIGAAWLWDGAPRNWLTEIIRPMLNEAHAGVFIGWWLQDVLHVLADSL